MKIIPIGKALATALLLSLCFQSGIANAARLDISQSPLMLVDSVSPNLIFTLDDSGSMEFAYAPDGLDDEGFTVNGVEICPTNSRWSTEYTNGCRNTRRAKSSDFNPIYYNPGNTYLVPRKADGTRYDTTSFSSAPWNGFTGSGKINLAIEYRPVWHNNWSTTDGTRYARHPENSGFNNRDSGTHAYYYVYDESLGGCTKEKHDDNCYKKQQPSTDEEKQNFANWYSFYRTRGLATISAAHLAFYELPSSIRFTWQRINQNSSPLSSNFDIYSSDHKSTFFTWLRDNSSFTGGTPLRRSMVRAGNFLSANNTAWYNTPGDSNSGIYGCRPAYHILMADGIWNGTDPNKPGSYKHDNTTWNTPDGRSYSPAAPFQHEEDHTLADLAMHYWATDLRPSTPNEIKPYISYSSSNAHDEYWDPRNNPATWQHMVNFTVGLGLTGSLVQSDVLWEQDKGTFESSGYNNLLAGTPWPDVGAVNSSNIGKVYDLWHAAINSRGEFFSADNPEDLVQSFRDILNRIAQRTSTAAAAGSTTSVSSDDPDDPYNLSIVNRAFFPEYNSEDWSGDLKRYDIKRQSDGTITRDLEWSARSLLTSDSGRNIKMGGGRGDSGLHDFFYSNLSNDLQDIFNSDPDRSSTTADDKGVERVNYLRGKRAGEGTAKGTFRTRSTVLGDIINSTPVVVGAPSYIPYLADKIDGDAGSYLTFQEQYADRPELVYVGANDGMLHAFSADTGQEVFAFVPQAALHNMPKLTGQTYQGGAHRFFVDGSPVVRDLYFDNNWHTVLFGTLGAGGRSLFALDITNPGTDGNGIKLLWEITSDDEGYENLGYSFPDPEVVRLHSGEWALLQGNGYNSENDVASLFIIDVEEGTLIKELIVDTGEDGPNGLSSIRGADNNGDGLVDYAYAGDIQGNLWRFDLIKTVNNDDIADPFKKTVQTGVTSADYEVSYGGTPLYKAIYPITGETDRTQAITAAPSLVRHPTLLGYVVVFGTGKYFETSDAAPDTIKANSVYGIWDRMTKAQNTSSVLAGSLTRDDLQSQSIQEQRVTSFSQEDGSSTSRLVRYITQDPVVWYPEGTLHGDESDPANVRTWGWYLDLEVNGTKSGEMMVDNMMVRGDTLLFGTLTPNSDPCADGNEYWAYGINAQTGARTKHPTFDFNQDNLFDIRDTDLGITPSGYSTESPIALTRDGSVIDSGGSVSFATSPDLHGRQSWQSMPLEVDE